MSDNPQQQQVNSPLVLSDPGKMAESSYEQNLRRSIITIHNDSSLTPAQKAKNIQVKFVIYNLAYSF